MYVYIISWFGNNDKIREKRITYHNKQIDWFLERNYKLVILAQEYRDEEYRNDSSITYIESELNPPGKARNKLLKEFYSSSDDFSLFCDNDTILYHHCHGDTFHIDLEKNVDRYVDLDCALPINPMNEPFNHLYHKNPKLYRENHVFKKSHHCKGSLFILRNLKKYYNIEYYYPDVYNFNEEIGSFIPGEDGHLALFLIHSGKGVYKFENIILKELGSNNSTWSPSNEYRNKLKSIQNNTVIKLWNNHGLSIKSNGNIQQKDFMKQFFKKPDKLIIPVVDDEFFQF